MNCLEVVTDYPGELVPIRVDTTLVALHECCRFAPRLSRVAVLYAAGDPNVHHALQSLDSAARTLDIRLQLVEVRDASGLVAAFSTITTARAQGLVVVAGSVTFGMGQRIAELALAHQLPSSHAFRETVQAGGLVGLGPNYYEMAKQVAAYVSKILKGAKPADLPVEEPARMSLVINMKTAKALGLTIPQSLLLRADQVIE